MEERVMAVIVAEHECAQGLLGHLTLDVPKTLNSLTLDMVDALQAALDDWRDRDDIGHSD